MSVYVTKDDMPQGFVFETGLVLPQNNDHVTTMARFLLNTPGSQTDRQILAEVGVHTTNYNVELQLKTPWKDVGARWRYVNKDYEKSAELLLKVDDETKVQLLASIRDVSVSQTNTELNTKLKVVLPWIDDITATGVIHNSGRNVSISAQVSRSNETIIALQGTCTGIHNEHIHVHLRTFLITPCR